jgi:hypothetical protein
MRRCWHRTSRRCSPSTSPPVPDQIDALLAGIASVRDRRGDFVVQLALYFFSLQQQAVDGELDDDLRRLARGLRDLELPVLLRIGYEFNNPWQRYAPAAYVPAFRRTVQIFREEGPADIAFVWHASTLGLAEQDPTAWYPGDAFVDWWGVSLFHREELDAPALATFLERARDAGHPVLIAEAAPVLASPVPGRVRGAGSAEEALAWYRTFFRLVDERPAILAISLIAVDFRRLGADMPTPGWPDTRLGAWTGVPALVKHEFAKARYLHRTELEQGLVGRSGR